MRMCAEASCTHTRTITAAQKKRFMGPSAAPILPLAGRLKEAIVGVVRVFDLVAVTQVREEAFEGLILVRRHFQRSQDASEIRSVISIMKERNVPFSAECVEELQQSSGT